MFEDYKEAVIGDYQAKMADGTLSLNLIKPTPAGIKKLWLFVFETRRKRDDIKTLQLFFGEKDNDEGYGRALKKIEVDRFRPLCNFLNKETKNPDDKIIELLAWLIDFTPRPYKPGFTVADIQRNAVDAAQDDVLTQPLIEEDAADIYGGSSRVGSPTAPTRNQPQHSLLKKLAVHRYKILIMIGVLLTGGIGISLNKSQQNGSFLPFLKPGNQCMYWSDDHYEEVACDTKPPYGQAVALDKFKLDYFKKITRPDTLTLSDMNKVWYLKANHQLELYTADGYHPEQPQRRLRPLTKYMFDKYVAGKQ